MAAARRLSTQILLSQLAILTVASTAGLVLSAQAARRGQDAQSEQRALTVARVTAALPQVARSLDGATSTTASLRSWRYAPAPPTS